MGLECFTATPFPPIPVDTDPLYRIETFPGHCMPLKWMGKHFNEIPLIPELNSPDPSRPKGIKVHRVEAVEEKQGLNPFLVSITTPWAINCLFYRGGAGVLGLCRTKTPFESI